MGRLGTWPPSGCVLQTMCDSSVAGEGSGDHAIQDRGHALLEFCTVGHSPHQVQTCWCRHEAVLQMSMAARAKWGCVPQSHGAVHRAVRWLCSPKTCQRSERCASHAPSSSNPARESGVIESRERDITTRKHRASRCARERR